ncbi:MAG TPA: heavy metal translocating P-type ATPase [Candidatus Competibacteraceae bacterium]|nr:heavy metal translocating P-type ATPase [Candidatus Competibacteraceae bacterium]
MDAVDATVPDAIAGDCFHCGLPVPAGNPFRAAVDGAERAFCCHGCQAVAQAIVAAGLSDFYRHRDIPARRAAELVPTELREMALYDRADVQKGFVRTADEHVREADLILEGIVCAACIWLNERHVSSLPGVQEFRVNYTTHRAHLRWDERRTQLSAILAAIAAIGYRAYPFDAGRQEALHQRERAVALRHLAVAALGMMQVMMLAVALWIGRSEGMDPAMTQFLRWICLVLSVPVVFYSGQSFYRNAWRDLRRRRAGMDVPVAIAVLATFAASAWSTVVGQGEIYFESITMFIFLLLAGRFLEMSARQRAAHAAEALARLQPALATRIGADGGEEVVPAIELEPGDRVRIKPGEGVPADGVVLQGRSSVDESLLTGESLPRGKGPGDGLVAGTVNVESPLLMRVEKVGPDTVLSGIQRLLDRAQSEKPAIARWSEQGTGWFVIAVLALTALAGLAWYPLDPQQSFEVMLAMLVVSCPCALALATPTALTVATGWLTQVGVLTTRGHALETLARATRLVFDKTGTLTRGRLRLDAVVPLGALEESRCLALAAALERHSEHPLAKVLAAASDAAVSATAVTALPGQGVEGVIDGRRYRVGSLAYVSELAPAMSAARLHQAAASRPDASHALLGDEDGPLALFLLSDTLRPDARATVDGLRALGLQVSLLSGDGPGPVTQVAERLGIADRRAALTPEGKLAALRQWQQQGEVVVMVGDGVNDAPVLSAAHVSLAMASGTQLAHASADLLLYSDRLEQLLEALSTARRTMIVIRQNLAWSLVYNIIALPVAALGWITPWLAALGMSLSSLLVVLNALRLRQPPQMPVRGVEAPT